MRLRGFFAVLPHLKARGRAAGGVTMSINQNTANAAVSAKTGSFAQSLTAIVLGLFVVGFVGFSHVEAVHNAAHDTRHANAFPCH
jgi:cobalt transporter subunit CbtB